MGFAQMGCGKDRRTAEGGGCGGDEGGLEKMRHFGKKWRENGNDSEMAKRKKGAVLCFMEMDFLNVSKERVGGEFNYITGGFW